MQKIEKLFQQLLDLKASDLHLGVGYPPFARARGELVPLREQAMTQQEMESLLFEIVNPQQHKQIIEELDLDFAYSFGDKARFRANYFYKVAGLGAVFRTIPTKIITLAEL